MKSIGGNITAELQIKTTTTNEIGESITGYKDYLTLKGFLDYQGGGSDTLNYNAKLEESTHIFICDYTEIPKEELNLRLIIKGKVYDVLLIDNPMGLNKHLEIYLKYTGE